MNVQLLMNLFTGNIDTSASTFIRNVSPVDYAPDSLQHYNTAHGLRMMVCLAERGVTNGNFFGLRTQHMSQPLHFPRGDVTYAEGSFGFNVKAGTPYMVFLGLGSTARIGLRSHKMIMDGEAGRGTVDDILIGAAGYDEETIRITLEKVSDDQ
jgi:hypothetical protein